jgi:hypothetical protein
MRGFVTMALANAASAVTSMRFDMPPASSMTKHM